ncbi:MAG: hypothetical protein AAGF12_38185, partial [Myxococcota bacterium]
ASLLVTLSNDPCSRRIGGLIVAVGVVAAIPCSAMGQDSTTDTETALQVDANPLRSMRLDHLAAREQKGAVLLGWGLTNVVAGSLVAGLGRNDDLLLFGGVMAASWGIVNSLLALILFDFGGGRRRDIEAGRLGELDDLWAVRNEAVAQQLRSGQLFALNAGLDVAYIASGLLLFFLGQSEDNDTMRSFGAVIVGEGAFLLGFDIFAWLGANRRAGELTNLREPNR